MRTWRGLKALAHDAVEATVELVREGQDSARRAVMRANDVAEPVAGPEIAGAVRAVDGVIGVANAASLGAVAAVNRVVEGLTDVALDGAIAADRSPGDASEAPIPMRSDAVGTAAWVADAALGALNGAIGHHLARAANGLDLGLRLRHRDRWLGPGDAPDAEPGAPLVVWVHGLGTTEWCWALDAEALHGDPAATFGGMLERDAGMTPIFVRYNSGRRVADNGRALADAVDGLVNAMRGVPRVVLIGHSMGGLVARAACHAASRLGHGWLERVDLVVTLGTPHRGAPLARFGEATAASLGAIDLPATRVLARILAGRSAGIRDLEHGDVTLVGEDEPPAPLLDGITYAFLSATVARDPGHPLSRALGDLLVQVDSASGPHPHTVRVTPVTGTIGGVLHHQLQCHPAVYAELRRLVIAPSAPRPATEADRPTG